MVDKIFLSTVVADALFLSSGVMELVFSLVVQSQMKNTATDGEDVTRNLLYQRFPLTAGIVNAIFILVTFAVTLPGLVMPARSFLKVSGYMVTVCAIFTMCVAVFLWVMTLRMSEQFFNIYIDQEPDVQSLIQNSFQCCGYINSTTPAFVMDSTCSSPASAALLRGCSTSISSFANLHIDGIFTVLFGIVGEFKLHLLPNGIDAIFILCIACLLKDRKERERYRHIDEKAGYRQI
ncbi:Pls1 tetraspanin [Fusarium mexicanum]|uniref:Pls1 tetraspanin n=1 Tax=Fusarium mexicanum TaxID=751941 RepID=A0A8H5MXM3_9HYPO|nr:Pls1 tetraspanin [Fusarium mexicanum]